MDRIDKLIGARAEKYGSVKKVAVLEISQVILKLVRKFFDEEPNRVRIVSYKNQLLSLASDSPYVINRLNSSRNDLVKMINQELGESVVDEIRFVPY